MKVSKFNASGNDFVIFHSFDEKPKNDLAKLLCDRYDGVGADGLIVLLPHDKYDFKWQFYNCDGSEAFMCGNGSRVAALYAYKNNLAKKQMEFLTLSGVIKAEVFQNNVKSQLTKHKKLSEPFNEYGKTWHFYDTGVEHLVSFVEDLQVWNENEIKALRKKYNANVSLATLSDKLTLRTFERGIEGETLACGTAMAATFLAAFENGFIDKKTFQIQPKSKEILEVGFENERLFIKGVVRHIFDCVIQDEILFS